MNIKIYLICCTVLFFLACKKDEQSCSDGIFEPDKEEQTDCGGVCPPCDFNTTVIDSFLRVNVNGQEMIFSNYNLTKTPDWILRFQNDSLNIKVNFGDGDSLGGRPIKSIYSTAMYNGVDYSDFSGGTVVFANIDHNSNNLSGFFTAKFLSDSWPVDSLKITMGEFDNISW